MLLPQFPELSQVAIRYFSTLPTKPLLLHGSLKCILDLNCAALPGCPTVRALYPELAAPRLSRFVTSASYAAGCKSTLNKCAQFMLSIDNKWLTTATFSTQDPYLLSHTVVELIVAPLMSQQRAASRHYVMVRVRTNPVSM